MLQACCIDCRSAGAVSSADLLRPKSRQRLPNDLVLPVRMNASGVAPLFQPRHAGRIVDGQAALALALHAADARECRIS